MRKYRHKKITLKRILLLVLFFCLASGGIYFFLFSPVFRIKEIQVSGNQEVATQDIQDIVRRSIGGKKLWLLPKDNVFLLRQENLISELKKNFVKITNISVGRDGSRPVSTRLNLKIIERQAEAVVCHYYTKPCEVIDVGTEQCSVPTSEIFDSCFYVDQQGIAFKSAPRTQGSLILLAAANYDINLGWEGVKPHLIETMAQIKKVISEKVPGLLLDYFLIVSDQEIRLKTQAGWLVYFDSAADIFYQTTILEELLDKKIKDTENLEYIDLRTGDKVYYKLRN